MFDRKFEGPFWRIKPRSHSQEINNASLLLPKYLNFAITLFLCKYFVHISEKTA